MGSAEPLLEARNVSKTFPGLLALDGVSLTVSAGEIVGLVGQNGSGKSTLVKILAGVHAPDPGSEILLGRSPDGQETELHFIHQDLGLVGGLSTIENLELGHRFGVRAVLPAPVRREERRTRELITSFGVDFDVRRPIADLSAAERTIVAIARALDGWAHPRNVLVLDEPTASLHGKEVQKLFAVVRQVVARGAGAIFVSHRLDEVLALADRVVVLRDGSRIADMRRDEFTHDELVHLITGSLTSGSTAHGGAAQARPILEARGVRGATVKSLDLNLHAGEVLGISGVLGSGREEVASVLFGAAPGSAETLTVDGHALSRPDPRSAIAAGVAYVPADRHTHGMVMNMTVRENLTLPRLAG
jgi:ABC-type sugar transport system ATPase subunit